MDMAYYMKNNEEKGKYFILTEDTIGTEKKKKQILRITTYSNYHALKGEIFEKDLSKKHIFDTELTFVSTENPDRTITCVEEKLRRLKIQEYNLLIAVVFKTKRMTLLTSLIFKEIVGIEVGDLVSGDLGTNTGTTSRGEVCYIGPIAGKIGYYFGIRLEVGIFVVQFF